MGRGRRRGGQPLSTHAQAYFAHVEPALRSVCASVEVSLPDETVGNLLSQDITESTTEILRQWAVSVDESKLQDVLAELEAMEDLPDPPRVDAPVIPPGLSVPEQLEILQEFISSFQYNFTNVWSYFNINKRRPISRIMDTAKGIIRESLPIKCLEAVFLGIYLTVDMEDVDRVPCSFKSEVDDNTYRHIILAIRHQGRWGALGLSRKATLMYKPLEYASLADLMTEFRQCYEDCYHTVTKLKIGLPVSHDPFSSARVCWNACQISLKQISWDLARTILNEHVVSFNKNLALWKSKYDVPSDYRGPAKLAYEKQVESMFRKESGCRASISSPKSVYIPSYNKDSPGRHGPKSSPKRGRNGPKTPASPRRSSRKSPRTREEQVVVVEVDGGSESATAATDTHTGTLPPRSPRDTINNDHAKRAVTAARDPPLLPHEDVDVEIGQQGDPG